MRSPTIVSGQRRSLLPVLGLAAGLWAVLPPYSGPPLNTADVVEVVDHVVPGAVVLGLSAGSLALVRADRGDVGMFNLAAAGLCFLAGVWITSTHVPLAVDSARGLVPLGATLLHLASGPPIIALSLWLLVPLLRGPQQAPPH